MEPRRTVVELEATAATREALLEELREAARERSALERVPALVRRRIVGIVAVVVPLAEF